MDAILKFSSQSMLDEGLLIIGIDGHLNPGFSRSAWQTCRVSVDLFSEPKSRRRLIRQWKRFILNIRFYDINI
jgi:hypothetical protein